MMYLQYVNEYIFPQLKDKLGWNINDIQVIDSGCKFQTILTNVANMLPSQVLTGGVNGYRYSSHGFRVFSGPDFKIVYVYDTSESNSSLGIYIALKKDLFKIYRYFNHHSKRKLSAIKKPILSEKVLGQLENSVFKLLKNRRSLSLMGCNINKGILINGSPGNGKSTLCNYLRQICSVTKLRFSHHTNLGLMSKDHDIFSDYSEILICDDVDAQTLNRKYCDMCATILSRMDGVVKNRPMQIRIFTTTDDNSLIDPAFFRPGRIDEVITLNKPDANLRRQFVDNWHSDIKNNIPIETFVYETEDMSFAQLENIKRELIHENLINGNWNLDKAIASTKSFIIQDNAAKKKIGF
jgi:cell division protease FtsH